MVKTTRQIRNEQDRFGGYIPRTDSARRNVEVDLEVDPETELSFSRRTFVEPEYARPEKEREKREEPLYSTLDKPRRAVTLPPRPSKTAKRDPDDVMPRIRTHEDAKREVESAPARRGGVLSSRTKVMLAIYVVVAVTLAAIVIATGIALSSGTAAVGSLERAIESRNQTIAAQTDRILQLEDDTMLTGMATEQGMQKVNAVTEFELLGVTPPVEMAPRTNWFDRFCDWLSKIF